jgi:hypothetical protein
MRPILNYVTVVLLLWKSWINNKKGPALNSKGAGSFFEDSKVRKGNLQELTNKRMDMFCRSLESNDEKIKRSFTFVQDDSNTKKYM